LGGKEGLKGMGWGRPRKGKKEKEKNTGDVNGRQSTVRNVLKKGEEGGGH